MDESNANNNKDPFIEEEEMHQILNLRQDTSINTSNKDDGDVNNLNNIYSDMNRNINGENVERDDLVISKKTKTLHMLNKLLDLNLKFESDDLEFAYFKSYLAVTRLNFLKYIFFLIIFSICWLTYFSFSINNNLSQNVGKVENYVFLDYKKTNENDFSKSVTILNDSKYLNTNVLNKTVYLINKIKYAKNTVIKTDTFLIAYLSTVTAIFLIIFSFVLMIEINETRYRKLEKEIQKNELNKKVDTKKAERDLKLAMEEIVKKDEDNINFRKKLKSKYRNVSKLRKIYSKIAYTLSIIVVILMYMLCILPFLFSNLISLTFITHFIWFCIATLLMYLIYPFQMLISLITGILLSIIFEILSINKQMNLTKDSNLKNDSSLSMFNSVYLNSQILILVFIKLLLHSSLHLIASYLKLSIQGIKRETFLKVAHIHKAHLTAQQDKDITEKMIKSIMPPLFTHVFGKPEEFKKSVNCVHQMRPLFIYPVNEISILFADIVGFTRMSSTKTAEQLVFLLNDLYGRFDKLCEQAGCEKISTLGDCYYCVSGCLNSRLDHAKCCVEMGLLMVKEIELFNKEHGVDVNMRVGVHTGNALCGFIGGKRFRFDVWSGDVTLANKMESSGRAGWVHISEDTYKHLGGKYNTEVGEKYSGKSTYFVIRETKRETVADALKQFASYDADSSSSKNNENLNNDDENIIKNVDKSISSDSKNKRNELLISQNGGIELTEIELVNKRTVTFNEKDDQNLLLAAVKDVQFFKPDIHPLTMRFDRDQENRYQSYLVGSKDREKSQLSTSVTSFWTNSKNSLFLSVLISFITNLCVATSYFLSFVVSSMSSIEYKMTLSYRGNFVLILILYCIIILTQSIFLIYCLLKCNKIAGKKSKINKAKADNDLSETMLKSNENGIEQNNMHGYSVGFKSINNRKKDRKKFIKFVMIHFISIILMSIVPLYILTSSLPIISSILKSSWSSFFSIDKFLDSIISEKNFQINNSMINNINFNDGPKRINIFSIYSFMTYTIALIHFGSFIQLSSLFKTLVCFLFAFLYSLLGLIGIFDGKVFQDSYQKNYENNSNSDLNFDYNMINHSNFEINGYTLTRILNKPFNFYSYLFINCHIKQNIHIIVDLVLLLLFIWILNRQIELIQRLSFKYDQDAHLRVVNAREQKELASWLIDVVLPSHVVNHVKEKKQYSRNYDCVGVLFVSLCNFWEFFEESYEGGRELLRVLNEITVDFDRLFDDPKYKNVEKIKSIGSTIMIASGLNPDDNNNDKNSSKHLNDLIDFALELNEKLEAFNNEAMSVCHFKFQMRMGFNCGPVTAGVIGTERLLYDIWGDTVNVASRMDSTGQPGFMQTPKEVVMMLKNDYKFFERGTVQIKGKDQMITFFLNPKENKKTNQ